ncbi:MAG TPA: hypothetical protein PKA38_03825 [Candidatus Levybacteria bacterium]|nr:hypothetical protein [Candidatus Levybacteria bacterium]
MAKHEFLKKYEAYPLPRLDSGNLDNLYGVPDKNVIIRSKRGFTNQEFQRAKNLYAELNKDYGISTPLLKVLSPGVDGRAVVAVQKVQGILLEDAVGEGNDTLMPSVEGLCNGLMKYVLDKFERGGEYLSDIRLRQFMWGKRRTDEQNKAYFVDKDPLVGTYDPRRPMDNMLFIQKLPIDVGEMILFFEAKFGKGKISARKEFQSFTHKLMQDTYIRDFASNHLPTYTKFA